MNTEQYLDRINYRGPVSPSLEVLSELQEYHLLHVPFENLDIHRGVKIDLANLFDKIVTRRRGGFCYELNGLFYQLLQQIGFKVKMVSARVYESGNYGPEFDHMALIVTIANELYLSDVGFGEFIFAPVKIEFNKEVSDKRGLFKIERYDVPYMVVKKKHNDGNFIPEYIFSEAERSLDEFTGMCNYHQTSKSSHFTQKRICSLPTENGRISLTGNTLKITENGLVTERIISSEAEVHEILWSHFRIKL